MLNEIKWYFFPGKDSLTNENSGSYFPPANSWHSDKKSEVGKYLLEKAYQILLIEGEREIKHTDIK